MEDGSSFLDDADYYFEDALQVLLEKKRDYESSLLPKIQGNMTFLQLASAEGCTWAIPYLTGGKVDVNERDPNGCTPLHWAAANGRLEMVKALLQEGAHPEPTANLQFQDGITESITPGRLAHKKGHERISTFLLEYICNHSKGGTPTE